MTQKSEQRFSPSECFVVADSLLKVRDQEISFVSRPEVRDRQILVVGGRHVLFGSPSVASADFPFRTTVVVRMLPDTTGWHVLLDSSSGPNTVSEEAAQWMESYCEDAFEQMSADKLLTLVRNELLSPGDLTFAAEIAGRRLPGDMIVPVLSRLLSAYSPLVREGAVRGLAEHLSPEVRRTLEDALEDEKSWGVAETIKEVLADE